MDYAKALADALRDTLKYVDRLAEDNKGSMYGGFVSQAAMDARKAIAALSTHQQQGDYTNFKSIVADEYERIEGGSGNHIRQHIGATQSPRISLETALAAMGRIASISVAAASKVRAPQPDTVTEATDEMVWAAFDALHAGIAANDFTKDLAKRIVTAALEARRKAG